MKLFQEPSCAINDSIRQADLKRVNEIFKEYNFKQLRSLEDLTADQWFDMRDYFFRKGNLYAWDVARWIAIDREQKR